MASKNVLTLHSFWSYLVWRISARAFKCFQKIVQCECSLGNHIAGRFSLLIWKADNIFACTRHNWKERYKAIKNKLKGGLSSLRKLKNILPQRKLDQVYKALFESHLRYGNIVWSTLSNTKLSQLQRLQTRAKKLIANAKHKDGWTCKWLFVKSLISFDQGVMAYKILHDLCPENLRHKFTERSLI